MTNLQVLHLTKVKTAIFVFAFTVLSVLTPMLAHYLGGVAAGRLFLPMHFFVLAGALLAGWQAGLAIGVLTPLISYSLTGMPPAMVLPFVVIEIAAYGFLAGFFQQKMKNIWLSLVGALILGRAVLFAGLILLPTKLAAMPFVVSAVKDGWRGIALQILLVPVAVISLRKFLGNEIKQ
ncbi:MAG: ECF transporter S component [Candidatus Portnoybacteria bacterium]|nr:ECF transporter S component [Candidatus Portnoybacteria bacterium]MDD4982451.1 ECF transporter S component [Candidatus Portnoybacteria bacterium]